MVMKFLTYVERVLIPEVGEVTRPKPGARDQCKTADILPDQYEDQYDALISTTNDTSRISKLHGG